MMELLDSVSDGLALLTPDGITCNSMLTRLLEVEPDPLATIRAWAAEAPAQLTYRERSLRLATTQRGEHCLLVVQDYTAGEKLAECLEQYRGQLAGVANLSHELRTPLNGIIGFSQLLLNDASGALTDQQREDVSCIYSAGSQLLHMLTSVLDYAKLQAGCMDIQLEPAVDLAKLVGEVTSMCRGLLYGRSVRVVADLPGKLPRLVADPVRLRQVLLNLVSNAIKFTSEGVIRVGARVERDQVLVTVADPGMGIPPEQQYKIFRPFEQVRNRSGAPGTGLGLTISKWIVERHHGQIGFTSEPGVGTVFSFSVPYQQAAAGPVVLLVSGDDGAARLYERFLGRAGYHLARSRARGGGLLSEAAQLHPDAVLIDFEQGGGWQVALDLLRAGCCPTVLMASLEAGRGFTLGDVYWLMGGRIAGGRAPNGGRRRAVVWGTDDLGLRALGYQVQQVGSQAEVVDLAGGGDAVVGIPLVPAGIGLVAWLRQQQATRATPVVLHADGADVAALQDEVEAHVDALDAPAVLNDVARVLNVRVGRPT